MSLHYSLFFSSPKRQATWSAAVEGEEVLFLLYCYCTKHPFPFSSKNPIIYVGIFLFAVSPPREQGGARRQDRVNQSKLGSCVES